MQESMLEYHYLQCGRLIAICDVLCEDMKLVIIWERIPGKNQTRSKELTNILNVFFNEIKIHGISSLAKIAVLLCTAKYTKKNSVWSLLLQCYKIA